MPTLCWWLAKKNPQIEPYTYTAFVKAVISIQGGEALLRKTLQANLEHRCAHLGPQCHHSEIVFEDDYRFVIDYN
jgi:hypothetical protein